MAEIKNRNTADLKTTFLKKTPLLKHIGTHFKI